MITSEYQAVDYLDTVFTLLDLLIPGVARVTNPISITQLNYTHSSFPGEHHHWKYRLSFGVFASFSFNTETSCRTEVATQKSAMGQAQRRNVSSHHTKQKDY